MIPLLEYHKEMIKKIMSEDVLTIISPGLGLEYVLSGLIYIMTNSDNLILILNYESEDYEFIYNNSQQKDKIKRVNSKMTVKDRVKCYLTDGILFVNSRILIYDMLVRKIPLNFITGILVLNSHTIQETAQLEFALKLFRSSNKKAFVKAFSDRPTWFTAEFNRVSRVSRLLYVNSIQIWPRFHVQIATEIDAHEIEVEEICVPLSETQSLMQMVLMDLISKTTALFLKSSPELKSYSDLFTVDSIISRDFFKTTFSLYSLLITDYSKALYHDIKEIRKLLYNITSLNAFQFHQKLHQLKDKYKYSFDNSRNVVFGGDWILSTSGESLFSYSAERFKLISKIYHENKQSVMKCLDEISPKWRALSDTIEELAQQSENTSVLILALPDSNINSFFKFMTNPNQVIAKYCNLNAAVDEAPVEEEFIDFTQRCSWSSKISFRILESVDMYSMRQVLNEFQPKNIIMYDTLLESIRIIETHRCFYKNINFKVFMIFYRNSIEEKLYLTSLNNEKQAYEILIQEKALMAKVVESADEDPLDVTIVEDSRKKEDDTPGSVIVDVREFGSELPLALNKAGYDIKPITLEIGDYVPSEDYGIERKAISDLVGSLNSGRLYYQALALSRYYKNCFLLIEFPENLFYNSVVSRKFHFDKRSRTNPYYVQNKLVLLTIHCPLMKLLWSPSLDFCCKLFKQLKRNKPEPDPSLASSLTSFDAIDSVNVDSNKSCDLLLKLPGVSYKNLRKISSTSINFIQLCQLTESEMNEISEEGSKLFDFFNQEVKFAP